MLGHASAHEMNSFGGGSLLCKHMRSRGDLPSSGSRFTPSYHPRRPMTAMQPANNPPMEPSHHSATVQAIARLRAYVLTHELQRSNHPYMPAYRKRLQSSLDTPGGVVHADFMRCSMESASSASRFQHNRAVGRALHKAAAEAGACLHAARRQPNPASHAGGDALMAERRIQHVQTRMLRQSRERPHSAY